jgi:2-amino-4-hydroxy-6-hydroxymethyldihydropteridine diphosphokinase
MAEAGPESLTEALIGLGGNIGDARRTIDRAVDMLCNGTAVRLDARSSDYRTPPWGVTDQPAFVNAAIAVATSLAPRAIDIDLLAYDDLVLHDPALTLPHPRLFERAFVLVPLAEIAPDRVIAGIRVRDALARVDADGIKKL